MREIKFLSLVVPAFKQQKTIVRDIKNLNNILSPLPIEYEIIVVVDGFIDKTFENVQKIKNKTIKVLGYKKNHGKGFAVRYGMQRAKGDIIGFIDSGMDIEPTGIAMLLNHMIWYDADIIVGSKLHPVSQVNYPLWRKIISWGYRNFTRLFFGFKVRDTQVGLKIFRKDVVRDLLPRLLIKRFAFDVEMLAVAYSLGYRRIYEAPIKLKFTGISSVPIYKSKNFWKLIFGMLLDTLAIYYRLKILHYYDSNNKKKWLKIS